MQAVWPLLAYYLSILGAVGVGALALTAGNSPVLVAVKAGAALLVFSTLGWGLNMALFAAANSPVVRPSPPRSNDNPGPQDGPPSTDQTAGAERDEPA